MSPDEIHQPTDWVPRRMAPMVAIGTVASHLVGASVGREGTALQMSGSLTDLLARTVRLGPARGGSRGHGREVAEMLVRERQCVAAREVEATRVAWNGYAGGSAASTARGDQTSRYFCAMGMRRPTPNALLVTLIPGAA